PAFEQLPVIVFTNTYLTSIVQDAWKAGATKCLAKASCTPNQVIGTLVNVLSSNGTAKTGGHAQRQQESAKQTYKEAHKDTEQDDRAFQNELRRTFVNGWPATLSGLRAQLQGIIKAENETVRLQSISELYRRVHALTGSSSITGISQIAQMADALE